MRETVVLQAIEQLRRDIGELEEELLAGMKAENERLHEYVTKLEQANIVLDSDNTELRNDMKDMQMIVADNHKLRELVRDMWSDGMCECDERGACAKCEYGYLDRMRELGIEVD